MRRRVRELIRELMRELKKTFLVSMIAKQQGHPFGDRVAIFLAVRRNGLSSLGVCKGTLLHRYTAH